MTGNALDVIAAAPPQFDEATLLGLLETEYGLSGTCRSLVSERDQNLRVTTATGERFVLKIASAAENPAATKFQVQALLHLQQQGLAFAVPSIVPTTSGRPTTMLDGHVVRVVEYVDGTLLADAALSEALANDLGRRLAELGVALRNFEHDGAAQDLLWDMQRAPELRNIVQHIDDAEVHDMVCGALDEFETSALPVFPALRTQVIHNDANPANVLVTEAGDAVAGFIDFGDMVSAPLVVDVAIAASYLRAPATESLRFIAPFIAGYQSVAPLSREEVDVLLTLIRTRLATTLAILFWRVADREPDDSYRQQSIASEADARDFLAALGSVRASDLFSQT